MKCLKIIFFKKKTNFKSFYITFNVTWKGPSGQKSMPLIDEADETGGYGVLMNKYTRKEEKI